LAAFTATPRRRGARVARDDRGANLVEFALLSIPFLAVTLGLVDGGRVIFAYSALAHGTREAARKAIVSGAQSTSPATATQLEAYVRQQAIGLTPADVTVTTTWLPDNNPGSKVRLDSTYTFQPLTTFAFKTTIPLRSRAEMVFTR
jgi:Flp pilus assembly protein TadG